MLTHVVLQDVIYSDHNNFVRPEERIMVHTKVSRDLCFSHAYFWDGLIRFIRMLLCSTIGYSSIVLCGCFFQNQGGIQDPSKER